MSCKGDQPVGIHEVSHAEGRGGGQGATGMSARRDSGEGGMQAEFWISSSKQQEGSETGVGGGKNRPTIDLASPRAGAL